MKKLSVCCYDCFASYELASAMFTVAYFCADGRLASGYGSCSLTKYAGADVYIGPCVVNGSLFFLAQNQQDKTYAGAGCQYGNANKEDKGQAFVFLFVTMSAVFGSPYGGDGFLGGVRDFGGGGGFCGGGIDGRCLFYHKGIFYVLFFAGAYCADCEGVSAWVSGGAGQLAIGGQGQTGLIEIICLAGVVGDSELGILVAP